MDSDKTSALYVAPLTKCDALTVCAWRYEGEYAVYNIPGWDTVVSQRWGIADKRLRRREFYSCAMTRAASRASSVCRSRKAAS